MFERAKLSNTKSLRFYPESCDHHVSFRHKNLPPDFQLECIEKKTPSVCGQPSVEKCPIYVHSLVRHNDGDVLMKGKHRISKGRHSVIEKLEETYWANWKPDKNKQKIKPEIKSIKSASERRRKIRVFPDAVPEGIKSPKTLLEMDREIQTEDVNISTPKKPSEETVENDPKFLKHTDSFILNSKKQKEEKEHFEQPRCIRLYKKPGKSRKFVSGGSYPLKSCLKPENGANKKSSFRLARPRSPLIVSSSFSSKLKGHKHQ